MVVIRNFHFEWNIFLKTRLRSFMEVITFRSFIYISFFLWFSSFVHYMRYMIMCDINGVWFVDEKKTTVHHPWRKIGRFYFFVTGYDSRKKKVLLREVMHPILNSIALLNRFWIVLIYKISNDIKYLIGLFEITKKRFPLPCWKQQIQKLKRINF